MKHSSPRRFPHSVTAAAIAGWIGGAVAWGISSGWTDATPYLRSNGRLDQLVAMLLGAASGALVLMARARHRRDSLMPALAAGALLGGIPALIGATILLWLPSADTAGRFVLMRVLAWALSTSFAAAALSRFTRTPAMRISLESLALGALGGAIGGAIYSLPGPAELWLPVAMAWTGAAIGVAGVGPLLWRAAVTVHVLPPRDERRTMWSLHERALDRGASMMLSDAHVACVDDIVYVYPPPGGAVLDGYPFYRAVPVQRDALLAVGRARFRLSLGMRG